MYTVKHRYQDEQTFRAWLIEHEFASKEECLVQVFYGFSDSVLVDAISTNLKECVPNAHIIGSTTDGEVFGDVVVTDEIIVNVTVFEKSRVKSAFVDYETTSFDMGKEIASKLDGDDVKVMILFTTGFAINGEDFLAGVDDVSKGRYIIAGGMAGDGGKFLQTYLCENNHIINKGVVGVAISGEALRVVSDYRFGWEPIGMPMRVTKSDKNRVYELDGKNIIEIYKKYFGEDIASELPKIGVEIPLIVERNNLKMGRACIKKFDDNSLLFSGNVNEGEIVRFGIGNVEDILTKTESISDDFLNSFSPESTFIYSCMARRRLLEERSSQELQNMHFGCEMSGFFTYGEFFSDEDGVYLFNETMTFLMLSENITHHSYSPLFKKKATEDVCENKMIQALTHMTNVMAREWQERLNMEALRKKEQEKQIFQQAKQAQMGEMIGMIAHQWRQPLNAISATGINLSLLSSMGMLEPEKVEQSSEFIQAQCQKMSKTIDTFMNFVKPAKEKREFKITNTIDSIMQIMGTQLANHNIKVKIEAKDKDITLIGYEDLLEQVIINLLSNARDAFGDIEKEAKYIKIDISKENDIPIVRVEDNAGGIKDEVKDKIFNPYFTTKEQGKGTGLGLYMSMDIMKKSFKGELIHSNTNDGSLFEVICGRRG